MIVLYTRNDFKLIRLKMIWYVVKVEYIWMSIVQNVLKKLRRSFTNSVVKIRELINQSLHLLNDVYTARKMILFQK